MIDKEQITGERNKYSIGDRVHVKDMGAATVTGLYPFFMTVVRGTADCQRHGYTKAESILWADAMQNVTKANR